MLFNSYYFVLYFLPLVLTGYHLCRRFGWYRAALLELTAASLFFYAYDNVRYLPVLAVSIVVNWQIACMIDRQQRKRMGGGSGERGSGERDSKEGKGSSKAAGSRGGAGRWLLAFGILLNIGSIFYFKYFYFFAENCNRLLGTSLPLKAVALPLGISFFTFQQISYLVDTYRGETRGYQFIEYAAFVSFFPQLVAGPIVLHDELIGQFRGMRGAEAVAGGMDGGADRETGEELESGKDKDTGGEWGTCTGKGGIDHDRFAAGCYISAVGLFKKVLIADTFGRAVAWGWAALPALSWLELVCVMLSYTFQIYFDFSGYCDMAIGLGKLFGLDLPVNFASPYKAVSVVDFWKRWHMTLTRFLRNYVYFPLGGSRKGEKRTYGNILLVFLVSGLWHGANWTFILWGLIHGLAQVIERIFQKSLARCSRSLRWLYTFIFVNLMWLLFRADDVGQAFSLYKRLLKADSFSLSKDLTDVFVLPEVETTLQAFRSLLLRVIGQNAQAARLVGALWDKSSRIYMWVFLLGALFLCLGFPHLHEKDFKPTAAKAVGAALLLVWAVMSFAGVSTFLYFNF